MDLVWIQCLQDQDRKKTSRFNCSVSVIQEPNSPAGSPPHSPHGNGLDRAPSLRKELPGISSAGEGPTTPNPRSPTPGKSKDSVQVGQTHWTKQLSAPLNHH